MKCDNCKDERERREELEVVAAALYLGHDDAKEQFDMYRAVYIAPPADPGPAEKCDPLPVNSKGEYECGHEWNWTPDAGRYVCTVEGCLGGSKPPAAPDAAMPLVVEAQIYRNILLKVLETCTEREFFDRLFDGYSVTIDAATGELIYAKFLAAVESPDHSPFIERVRERTFRKCSHDYERCECYVEAMHEIRAEMGRKGE